METLLSKLQKKISTIFEADKRIIAVYLFGSQADGTAHLQSDMDIGVMIDPQIQDEFRLDDEIELEIKIEAVLKTDCFDLIVLNKVPLTMQFRIISPAKLIYVKDDDLRCDMEVRIMQKYYDHLPYLQELNKKYFKELSKEYSYD